MENVSKLLLLYEENQRRSLEEGEVYYVLNSCWWRNLLQTPPLIEDIHNEELLLTAQVLKPKLTEMEDFVLCCEELWHEILLFLQSVNKNVDVSIPRRVASRSNHKFIQLYPHVFKLYYCSEAMIAPVEINIDGEAVFFMANSDWTLAQLQNNAVKLIESYNFSVQKDSLDHQFCFYHPKSKKWQAFDTQGSHVLLEQVDELIIGNEPFSKLMIEWKCRSPLRKHREGERVEKFRFFFYSDIWRDLWFESLRKDDLLDAKDGENKWYESVVVLKKESSVVVHFYGWHAKWDSELSLSSNRIAPLYHRVKDWRQQLSKDSQLEIAIEPGQIPVLLDSDRKFNKWYFGVVKDLSYDKETHRIIKVLVEVDLCGAGNDSNNLRKIHDAFAGKNPSGYILNLEYEIMSELLCPLYTHKKRPPQQQQIFYSSTNDRIRPITTNGVVGLQNLGNTCFMNSMLQCLMHCHPLTQYFMAKLSQPLSLYVYEKEINASNPLGMGGKIARAYARLIQKMYSLTGVMEDDGVLSPMDLKRVIGEFAPQFAGYHQHDSQELMSFVLDGLHEDLNRIPHHKKPTYSSSDLEKLTPQECWLQYKSRNDSIIVDLFTGQLKSHVVCPVCRYASQTFDPYMSLSLPMTCSPSTSSTKLIVLLFQNGELPLQCKLALRNGNADLKDVLEQIYCLLPNLPRHSIIAPIVTNTEIVGFHQQDVPIQQIQNEKDSKLCLYILSNPFLTYQFASSSSTFFASTKKQFFLIGLTHHPPVCLSPSHTLESLKDSSSNSSSKIRRVEYGAIENAPLLVEIPNSCISFASLHVIIWESVKRLVKTESDHRKTFGLLDNEELPYNLYILKVNSINRMASRWKEGLPKDQIFLHIPSNTESNGEFEAQSILEQIGPFRFHLEWTLTGYEYGYNAKVGNQIKLHESMRNLSLSDPSCIPRNPFNSTGYLGSGNEKKSFQLQECLDSFLEEEELSEADSWYCPKCRKHVCAFKKFDLYSLPKILILHLKRFSYNSLYSSHVMMHRDKLDALVEFPLQDLDMSPYVISNPNAKSRRYDLFAVSEHSGGCGGGHYTAVAKHKDQWYRFNDRFVKSIKPEEAITSQAYVLFYQRQD